jgi:23S rRNA (uridine2552-2'-O)-methyltransferase
VKDKRRDYARADVHARAARAQGYPARSVFKLEEIDRRCRIFRGGQRVLDLGAAPGSWSMFASQRIGASGRVLAVDRSEIEQVLPANVRVLQLDLTATDAAALSEFAPYDVVMSDMAPNTSGSKTRDQALSEELCLRALWAADNLGREGSHFVTKLFMSAAFAELKRLLVQRYTEFRTIRPPATRTQSSEVFLVGLGRKPKAPAESTPFQP